MGSIVIGGYFLLFWHPIQYQSDSSQQRPVNDYLVPLVTCTLTDSIVCLDTMLICCCLLNTIIVIIIEFWDFSWSLLCSTQVSILVLVSLEANIIGYWILGAFLGIVLTLGDSNAECPSSQWGSSAQSVSTYCWLLTAEWLSYYSLVWLTVTVQYDTLCVITVVKDSVYSDDALCIGACALWFLYTIILHVQHVVC